MARRGTSENSDPQKKAIPRQLMADGPRSPEVENAVIAAAMYLDSAAETVLDLCDAFDFTQPEARAVYREIRKLVDEKRAPDPTSIRGRLHETGRLTPAIEVYIATCDAHLPAMVADIDGFARTLRNLTTRRRTMESAVRAFLDARDSEDDAAEIVQRNQERLGRPLERLFRSSEWTSFAELVTGYEALKIPEGGRVPMVGPSWGLRCLDELTGGQPRGDLILISGRPGMAKTALACNVAANDADAGEVVGFFSLEMMHAKMAMRLLAQQLGKRHSDVRFKRLDPGDLATLERLKPIFAQWKLFFQFDQGQHVSEIRAKARALRMSQGRLDVLIVDYLQLAKGDGQSRNERVDHIAESLKNLAKELDCCVIALCQLSREPEKRDDKRPRLADLRDSGGLEQHSDTVLGLYRERYYNRAWDGGDKSLIRILKQRDGEVGDLEVFFDEETQEWYEDEGGSGGGRRERQSGLSFIM